MALLAIWSWSPSWRAAASSVRVPLAEVFLGSGGEEKKWEKSGGKTMRKVGGKPYFFECFKGLGKGKACGRSFVVFRFEKWFLLGKALGRSGNSMGRWRSAVVVLAVVHLTPSILGMMTILL